MDLSMNVSGGKRQILFGTNNEAKIMHVRAFLEGLPVEIRCPKEFGIQIDVREDGLSPEENAAHKARTYYAEARMPTFAIDAGLWIEKFPEANQPGVWVRRVFGKNRVATDEEILDHYRKGLEKVGGTSPGLWRIAISFMASPQQMDTRQFTLKTMMTAQASNIFQRGASLNSLMIDPVTSKYYSEMPFQERPDAVSIREILRQQIERVDVDSSPTFC